MGALKHLLDWIVDFLSTIFDFFKSILENLQMLFEYVGLVADMAYSLIASLPTWLQAFGTITIVVSILYIILGRSTGGSKE